MKKVNVFFQAKWNSTQSNPFYYTKDIVNRFIIEPGVGLIINMSSYMKKTVIYFLFLFTTFGLLAPKISQAQSKAQITLAGYKHNPPVRTTGTGFVTVQLKNDTLKVSGDFSELSSWYSGGYIMVGQKGESGNQLFRLKADIGDNRTQGSFTPKQNSFALKEAHKELLQAGELYINIASANHRHGELRGQIPPLKNG